MKIGIEGLQRDLSFESPEEKRSRLNGSIKEARASGRTLTEEESEFIDEEIEENLEDRRQTHIN
jgi:hypothetical protein